MCGVNGKLCESLLPIKTCGQFSQSEPWSVGVSNVSAVSFGVINISVVSLVQECHLVSLTLVLCH